jgi:hypothetical protein
LQLRQLPSADTIQKYYEALTPEIRSEARAVEAFLRDLSEMVKVNYFQSIDATERKMTRVQLAREGYYDFWSLHETLETPNVGAPPAIPLPPLEPPPPTVMLGMMQQMAQPGVMQAMLGGMAPPQFTDPDTNRTFTLDPASGQLLELRIPTTVTERLRAAPRHRADRLAGGRKASGQAPPKQGVEVRRRGWAATDDRVGQSEDASGSGEGLDNLGSV